MKLSHLSLLPLFALTLFAYQNCGGKHFTGDQTPSASLASEPARGGVPYDGKVFVNGDEPCADGTLVSARVVLKNATEGHLVREHCAPVTPPRPVTDFILTAPDALTLQSRRFTLEQPAAPVPPFASWYIQLQGAPRAIAATYYDVDAESSPATIAALKAAGHHVLCNFSAGTSENFRADRTQFTAADLGATAAGGERWLDTRSPNVRRIMVARVAAAAARGCDGVDFDSPDGSANPTGFPLNSASQLDYAQFLAFAAHDRGLLAVLRHVPSLMPNLVDVFDLAIAEQSFAGDYVDAFAPFSAVGKAVLAVEYGALSPDVCTRARNSGISLIGADAALDGGGFSTCP